MWGKVALAGSAVALIAAAGAGYVAVVGIEVDATQDNLVGHWTGDKGTALALNSLLTLPTVATDRALQPSGQVWPPPLTRSSTTSPPFEHPW